MHYVHELLESKGRAVHGVRPDATVLDAIREMDRLHIGALVVLDPSDPGVPAGILSERDYARRVILKGRRSADTAVREVMTEDLVTVDEHATIDECMGLMTDGRVRHLPVLSGGTVVGMVSIGDLVKAIIQRQAQTIQHLHAYISG